MQQCGDKKITRHLSHQITSPGSYQPKGRVYTDVGTTTCACPTFTLPRFTFSYKLPAGKTKK